MVGCMTLALEFALVPLRTSRPMRGKGRAVSRFVRLTQVALFSMSFALALTLCHCAESESLGSPQEFAPYGCLGKGETADAPRCNVAEYADECIAAGYPHGFVAEEGCPRPIRQDPTNYANCIWRLRGVVGCKYVNGLECCP